MMSNPYIDYYQNQVGRGDWDVFRGIPVQYGYGLGSFFSSLFRKVIPLFTKGTRYIAPKLSQAASTIKPHLITAAKDVASGIMRDVGQKISSSLIPSQEGGLRRRLKRKRSGKLISLLKEYRASKTRRKKTKKRTTKKRKTKKRKSKKIKLDHLFA